MSSSAVTRSGFAKIIVAAGLLAGILDIADAIIFYGLRGVPAVRLLQGIAFALIGSAAFTMGMRSALLGLLLHFIIATTFAALYVFASAWLPLSRHPWLYGTLYGIAIYVVMNYIVLPLSHIRLRPLPPLFSLLNGIAALVVCVGIPIALIVRRYLPVNPS
jgi:uncharacterized membrane protein YagU involved in acid resistance